MTTLSRRQIKHCVRVSILASLIVQALPTSAGTSTQYKYDARGRLIEVSDNNKAVYYILDEAGNRTRVSNTPLAPPPPMPDPVINSFIAPDSVSRPSNITVSWSSSNTSYCKFAIFGDSSNYSNLPTTGSLTFYLYENTGIQIECFEGEKSAAQGKIVRISGGTSPGGPINQN